MKRKYVIPTAKGERFSADDYVPTCGMMDGSYIFNCNVYRGMLYLQNGMGDFAWDDAPEKKVEQKPERYQPEGTSEYYHSFVDYNNNGYENSDEAVYVWIEKNPNGPIREIVKM